MGYVNEFDRDGVDITDGRRAEANFARLFEERFGVKPLKTDSDEDKYDHIDFYMQVPAKNGELHTASVDVKSWKGEPDNVWIEFISYGHLGWLYGKAAYVAFETPDEKDFIIVKREDLMYLVKCVVPTVFTDKVESALCRIYTRYKRDGLFDCVTKIPRELLTTIKYWTLASSSVGMSE